MRAAVLGSGSAGNSLIVESRGRRLLVDAGFSCLQIERRLEILGQSAAKLEAVLLTHEHGDHCRGIKRLAKRHGIPIYATAGTLEHLALDPAEGYEIHTVESGRPFEVGGGKAAFRVECFSLPHDAREPVGFTIEDEAGRRLGLAADLGCRSQLAWARLRELDLLVIETNHDLQMLRGGPYPWHLKQRVASRHGHLSNREAAEGIAELVSDRLSAVLLYHLSRTNNSPTLAAQTMGEALARVDSSAEVIITDQDEPTAWVEIPDTVAD